MSAKRISMLVGDFNDDYEVMVPFQMLLMLGHEVHAVCPEQPADENAHKLLGILGTRIEV